jgi:hypothetical protein
LPGTSVSLPWAGVFRAKEVAGARIGGASGAMGKFTSGRRPAVMTGAGGGAGAVAGAGAGVGSGIDTAGTSVCPTAGADIGIDVTSRATAGGATGLSSALVIRVSEVAAGTGTDAGAGAGAVGCAGASRMRKSLAPRRLSFQGKSRPGRPNVWPPKVTLNSSA